MIDRQKLVEGVVKPRLSPVTYDLLVQELPGMLLISINIELVLLCLLATSSH